MKTLLAALGLAVTATEAEGLAALTALQAKIVDPATYVLKTVHDATLAQLAAATGELETTRSAARKKDVDALLEGALKAKKILPAQREHYATLCATDDGLAQVKKLLEASPAMLGASGLDDQDPETRAPAGELTREQLAVCSAMGIDPEAFKKTLAAA